VVLFTIVRQEMWIENKVYFSQDFDAFFDATARVQNVMTLLMKDQVFDDKDMYKLFIYHGLIKKIDEMSNQWVEMFEEEDFKKTRFFTQIFLTKLLSSKRVFTEKYGKWGEPVESDGGEEDEEEDANGDEEEQDEVVVTEYGWQVKSTLGLKR
jgi:hypothetical protein